MHRMLFILMALSTSPSLASADEWGRSPGTTSATLSADESAELKAMASSQSETQLIITTQWVREVSLGIGSASRSALRCFDRYDLDLVIVSEKCFVALK